MPIPTRKLADVKVGAIGYGAMNLTWVPNTPDEQAFTTIKTAIDAGIDCVNSGEFYGQPDRESGLKLLARFFAAEPTYAAPMFLSVKGAIRSNWKVDSSDEYLLESVTNINTLLGGAKKMDLFQPARVDTTRPIEETMKALMKLRDEGHFKYIGLSECSAATLRRAAAVGPVAAVEVEYSPWSLEIESNGILSTCKELGIAIIAYSPLGKGFLTGTLKSPADIPVGDHRHDFDRFKPENFPKNLVLVDKIVALAEKKGVTPAQFTLAWLLAQWEGIIPIPGSTRAAGVMEGAKAAEISLTEAELKEMREAPMTHQWSEVVDSLAELRTEAGGLAYSFVVGVHPHNAAQYDLATEARVTAAHQHKRCVGWGEIGLDYHYDQSPREVQQKVLRAQLRSSLASGLNKAITIHTREADDDIWKILTEELPREQKLHIHCYTDTPALATKLLLHFPNLFIGVTGVITYSSNLNTAQVVRDLALTTPPPSAPSDFLANPLRIVLETDAPYMVPSVLPPPSELGMKSGQKMPFSHSGMLPWTAEFVAKVGFSRSGRGGDRV
ncbi:hypothetical protein RQP46_008790 [Phenoliferia psychrophenolica]